MTTPGRPRQGDLPLFGMFSGSFVLSHVQQNRLCHLHNQVNERLKKPVFDCARLSEEYDCGCGDKPVKIESSSSTADPGPVDLEYDDVTGAGLIKGGR